MTGGGRSGDSPGFGLGSLSAENSVPTVAETLVLPFIVRVQLLAIPLHGLPQPKKPQAVSGVAVRVTWVPALNA